MVAKKISTFSFRLPSPLVSDETVPYSILGWGAMIKNKSSFFSRLLANFMYSSSSGVISTLFLSCIILLGKCSFQKRIFLCLAFSLISGDSGKSSIWESPSNLGEPRRPCFCSISYILLLPLHSRYKCASCFPLQNSGSDPFWQFQYLKFLCRRGYI